MTREAEPTTLWLNGAFVEDEPDPHFKSGESGGHKPSIGTSARISKSTLIDCHGPVTIGDYSFCGHRVMILTGGHDPFRFMADRQRAATPRPVVIGQGVWICSGAIICPGVTIGDHAVIGPGAVVMRNVRPYTVVAGNPARFVRRLRNEDDDATKAG